MRRGEKVSLASVALLGLSLMLLVGPASAQLVISEPAAGEDNLPPAPAGDVVAEVDSSGTSVTITWTVSPDDYVRQEPVGDDFTSGGVFVNVNDVAGYNVWRQVGDGDLEIIATVPAGVSEYTDTTVETGATYTYGVTAFDDAGNQSEPSFALPVTVGWLLREDFNDNGVVDLPDFFLFADRYGQPEFEVRYNLNDEDGIDLADFFLFADKFGYRIVDGEVVAP